MYSTQNNNNIIIIVYFRGSSFCPEFSELGKVHSIIPESVKVMALTATATKTTRASIIKLLDMHTPTVVSVHPGKNNIMTLYYVKEKSSISGSFAPICDKLAEKRTRMGRMIIFCHMYDEVTAIYFHFK